ncbi:MAG: class C sortase [Eubacteriaceae bacterium]|jgi:sortase A|nr:class C sortase [Eubacteriaceae bacterium]
MKIQKKWILSIVLLVVLIAILIPLLRDWYVNRLMVNAMTSYQRRVRRIDEGTKWDILNQAHLFNVDVMQRGYPVYDPFDFAKRTPFEQIDTMRYPEAYSPNRILGSLHIPKLKLKVPIINGMDAQALWDGVGYVRGSSLPVGGYDTHTVIAGNRGPGTSELFQFLELLKPGDYFFIDTMGIDMAYQVESVRIVQPDTSTYFSVQPGLDLATLMTPHPYLINQNRLLVTGHRVPYERELEYTIPVFSYKAEEFVAYVGVFIIGILGLTVLFKTQLGNKIRGIFKRRSISKGDPKEDS